MTQKKSSAKRMALLTALYIFFCLGGLSAWIAAYGYIPDYIGATMLEVGSTNSISAAVCAVMSVLVAVRAYETLGPRMCMMLGGLFLAAAGLVFGLFPSLPTLSVFFIILGSVNAVSTIACASKIIVNWFGSKCVPYISACVGASAIGSGVMQGLGSMVVDKYGIVYVFTGIYVVCGIISFVLALFIKNTPEEIGEVPFDDGQSMNQVETQAAATTGPAPKQSIYRQPMVWFFFLAALVGYFLTVPFISYASAYFPQHGMSATSTPIMLTVMGFASGAFGLVGGKFLEKVGVKTYVFFILICTIACNIFAGLYASIPSTWVAVVVVLSYGVGSMAVNMFAVTSPVIFGVGLSPEVTAKSMGFLYAGGILCPLAAAWMLTVAGYSGMYLMSIILAVVEMVLYVIVFSTIKRKKIA